MKTNIKMIVTPEQSKRVQEICFDNNIIWNRELANNLNFLEKPYLFILEHLETANSSYDFKSDELEEIDADLFIKTNGTCEENELKNFIQSQNEIKAGINEWAKQFNDVSLKLKKKNEILKKARIKRKNQREELHKLNLKLQKCISLEEHTEALNDSYLRNSQLENDFREVRNLLTIKNNVIKELENENYLNKSKLHLSSLNNVAQQKEIEKLKAVIEYLESKAK